MADQWFVERGGKKVGPIPTAQLKHLGATGKLKPTDQVQKQGVNKFVLAAAIKGLLPEAQGTVPDPRAIAATGQPVPIAIPHAPPQPPALPNRQPSIEGSGSALGAKRTAVVIADEANSTSAPKPTPANKTPETPKRLVLAAVTWVPSPAIALALIVGVGIGMVLGVALHSAMSTPASVRQSDTISKNSEPQNGPQPGLGDAKSPSAAAPRPKTGLNPSTKAQSVAGSAPDAVKRADPDGALSPHKDGKLGNAPDRTKLHAPDGGLALRGQDKTPVRRMDQGRKPDAGPLLGEWTLINRAEGQEFRSSLVIVRKRGPYVEGYVDFQVPGGPVCMQVIAGTFNESTRRLVLEARETATGYEETSQGQFTQRFECTVSSNGKEMSDFISVGNQGSGIARWVGGRNPSDALPDLVAVLDDTDEWPRLYQQLSTDFAVDGLHVYHGPDRYIVAQLAISDDERVRELARVWQALQTMADDVHSQAKQLSGELQRGLPAEVYAFALRTVGSGLEQKFSLDPVVDLLNSDVVRQKFQQDARQLALYVTEAIALNGMRGAVKEEFRIRRAPTLDARSTSATFKLGPASGIVAGIVAVRNTSRLVLHHCVIQSHMAVDKKRMDDYEHNFWKNNGAGMVLFGMAGVKMPPVVEAIRAGMAYDRLDKGFLAYLPVWKPGATVELPVAGADAIMNVGASIDVWIGCDAGTAQHDLDMQLVRRTARNWRTYRSPGRSR